MKKLSALVALLLTVICFGGWTNTEDREFFDRINEAREQVTAVKGSGEGYVQYHSETTDYDRHVVWTTTTFFGDYRSAGFYESITNGERYDYYTYSDGIYSYTHFLSDGEKIKTRRISPNPTSPIITLDMPEEAMVGTEIKELENGYRQLRIDYDLRRARGDSYVEDYNEYSVLVMGLFGAEMDVTHISYAFVVDEDYRVVTYRYGELGTIRLADESVAEYHFWHSTNYSYEDVELLDTPIDPDDLSEFVLRVDPYRDDVVPVDVPIVPDFPG